MAAVRVPTPSNPADFTTDALNLHAVAEHAPTCDSFAVDFKTLPGNAAWQRLAPGVRKRMVTATAKYAGVMPNVELSFTGRILAVFATPLGRPLATQTGTDVRVTVDVFPAPTGGSCWHLCYQFPGSAPVHVDSVKRLNRDGMLVECLGNAVQLHLDVREEQGALVFESTGYRIVLGPFEAHLPRFLAPGKTRVVQTDLGGGAFEFALTLDHPFFGRLAHQVGRFAPTGENP
jgi:hypothetical protein